MNRVKITVLRTTFNADLARSTARVAGAESYCYCNKTFVTSVTETV